MESNELQFWRSFAIYLADCHAATAESLPRSASQRQRDRMKSICGDAYEAIRTGGCDARLSRYWDGKQDHAVMDRLASVFVGAHDPAKNHVQSYGNSRG